MNRWFNPAELAADGSVVSYARDTLATADRVAWSNTLQAISVFDVSVAVPAITCPAEIVAAELDTVSDPRAMTDMAGPLPHGVLRVLKHARHMSVFTDPARLLGLIISRAVDPRV